MRDLFSQCTYVRTYVRVGHTQECQFALICTHVHAQELMLTCTDDGDRARGQPRRASAYEISKSTGFHVDFGFQNGFLDFKVDFWISVWISADSVRDFFRDGPLEIEDRDLMLLDNGGRGGQRGWSSATYVFCGVEC